MRGSIHQFVIKRLKATRGSWPLVAEGSGVPLSTLARIASGETENPGVKHVEALVAYFNKQNVGGSERGQMSG